MTALTPTNAAQLMALGMPWGLAQLVAALSVLQPTTDMVTPGGGAVNLPDIGGTIYVNNTGGVLLISPPPDPIEGMTFTIVDFGQTAGSFNVSWFGTLSGQTNPVLLDVSGASAVVQYHSGQWVRLR